MWSADHAVHSMLCQRNDVDAAIWTALGSNWSSVRNRPFSVEDAVHAWARPGKRKCGAPTQYSSRNAEGSFEITPARSTPEERFLKSETFQVKRQLLLFITIISTFVVAEDGLHWMMESRLFGITVRRFELLAIPWNEIATVSIENTDLGLAARIVPKRAGRFASPVSSRGPLKMRVKVDEEGAWLLPLRTAEQSREFAKACVSIGRLDVSSAT